MEQTCTIKFIIKLIKILDFYSKIYLFLYSHSIVATYFYNIFIFIYLL